MIKQLPVTRLAGVYRILKDIGITCTNTHVIADSGLQLLCDIVETKTGQTTLPTTKDLQTVAKMRELEQKQKESPETA